ncbi:MAG: elongation factor G [Deltaproteobacteria bacterium]|nr:elongation factor G [Deltaproteobacteria bacterium]
MKLENIRNIGISAHIDAGKTTLTERILFYTRRIHAMHDVKGKDGAGAVMDFMDLERERGITIASAATSVFWKGKNVNIIDTPGHVDFTMEVERSLRVLDGAVLVLCSVGGVQSQSITVDRQMARYKVPALAFVNKCDRSGANPDRVVAQLRDKLSHNAVAMQVPIGLEADFAGVVDVVRRKALYFDGPSGELLREEEVPAHLVEECERRRELLVDAASMYSDELMEAALEGGDVPAELIIPAVRKGVLTREITPVFFGSAYKNKGVQPLLDAVADYLPHPGEVANTAVDMANEGVEVPLCPDADKPLAALAFKLEDGRYGQLTYLRVYQGSVAKGDSVANARTGNKVKIGRIVRMHADQMEDIPKISAGDIGALFGVDCASGDTFCHPSMRVSMTGMHVPEPVISLALSPRDNKSGIQMAKALSRFTKEDPTFTSRVDQETSETIISGMGELHLEVYVERMRREYGVELSTGAPQVAYREAVSKKAAFDHIHKKQTGGAGQYARVTGYLEPDPEAEFSFENRVTGGRIPTVFIPACEKGFAEALGKGPLVEAPVTGVRVVLEDGNAHAVDSSDLAFATAARDAAKAAIAKAAPVILEPVMKVAVETPSEFQGAVMGLLTQRRGVILGAQDEGSLCVVEAEVPLAEMFGYSTDLRSATQGKAQFTMEFSAYRKAPAPVSERLKEKAREQKGKKRVA